MAIVRQTRQLSLPPAFTSLNYDNDVDDDVDVDDVDDDDDGGDGNDDDDVDDVDDSQMLNV